MASLRVTTAEEDAVISSAARWLENFYPEVSASRDVDIIVLHSTRYCSSDLELIWHTALANEILFLAGADKRAAALKALAA